MGSAPTWPRHVCSMIIALVVALLVITPSIDPLLCEGDELAAASDQSFQTIASHRDAAPAKHSQGPAECPHGHCHHAAPMAATLPPAETAHAMSAERHAWETLAERRSAPVFGLKRPPRA